MANTNIIRQLINVLLPTNGKKSIRAQDVRSVLGEIVNAVDDSAIWSNWTADPYDVPNENVKIYTAVSSGTYSNFGGIVVTEQDFSSGIVQIFKTADLWSKKITPISTASVMRVGKFAQSGFFNLSGLYISNGVFNRSPNWWSGSINLNTGGTLEYYLWGTVGANAVSFFNENNIFISGVNFIDSAAVQSGSVVIPANAKFAKVSTQSSHIHESYITYNTSFATTSNVNSFVSSEMNIKASHGYSALQRQKTLAEVDSQTGYTLKKIDVFPVNGFYTTDGSYNSSINWGSITFDVKHTKGMKVRLRSLTGARLISFFTAEGTFISAINAFSTELAFNEIEVEIPNEAVKATASFSRETGAGSTIEYFEKIDPRLDTISANLTDLAVKKATHGYTNGETIKSLAEVEALVNIASLSISDFPNKGFWATSGSYNTSLNWASVEVLVTPGKTISYNLFSSTGARLISYFDISGVFISAINASSTTSYHIGTSVVPAGAYKAVISISKSGGGESSFSYKVKVDASLQEINKTLASGVKGRILAVGKSLIADGVTKFNTVAAALAAWKQSDKIFVYSGVYEEKGLYIPDGLYMKALGFVHLKGYLPVTSTTSQVDTLSVLEWENSGYVDGFFITAQNMRYCVHSDFGNVSSRQKMVNCDLRHYGNSEIYNYRLANGTAVPNSAADVWRAQSAWGCGTMSGSTIELDACTLESPMRAFSVHNNSDFNLTQGYSIITCNNCTIKSSGYDLNGSKLPFEPAVSVQHLGSKTPDVVILNNCIVNGVITLQSSSQDCREFTQSVKGGGNSSHLMQVRHTVGSGKGMAYETTNQNVFVIKLSANSDAAMTISGALVETIFGDYETIKGSIGLNSYIKGRAKHSEIVPAVNAHTGSRNLTFKAGTEEITITLSASYVNNAALIADITAKAVTFTASLWWPGFDWWPEFTNEVSNYVNKGATAILRGRAVKKSGTGVAPMTSSDAASDFFAIALQDIPVGRSGACKFKGYMLRIWADGLWATTLADGDKIKVNANGSLSKSSGEGLVVSRCVSNENIAIGI
jgi:hypothetical protein